MSCNDDIQYWRVIQKYSTIAGQAPSIPPSDDHNDGTWSDTDLYVGELFMNISDNRIWYRALDGIHEIGGTVSGTGSFVGDYVPTGGGTFSGPIFAPTFSSNGIAAGLITASAFAGPQIGTSASTIYGDGSNLTGITVAWNGGTVSNPVQFINDVYLDSSVHIGGIVEGNAGGQVVFDAGIELINGHGVSASYFIGDGSGLTNLPTGTYSDTYTTMAGLSGTTIVFDRNDLPAAYTVDLSPILSTYSISSINWNSTTSELTILTEAGDIFTETINEFGSINVGSYVSANDFYGTFHGTFLGTFSDDIYTTGAALIGTTAEFYRTDGETYSIDLSSLSGSGGTQSLLQTLKQGNTMGTYSIVGGTSSVVAKFRVYDEFINMRNEGAVDIVDISMSPSEILVYNSSGQGITYDSPDPNLFMTNTLVHKQYVDDATGLANTLAKSNITGTHDIVITNNGMGATAFGIKTLNNTLDDAKFSFENNGGSSWSPAMRTENGDYTNLVTAGDINSFITSVESGAGVNTAGQVEVGPLKVNLTVDDFNATSNTKVLLDGTLADMLANNGIDSESKVTVSAASAVVRSEDYIGGEVSSITVGPYQIAYNASSAGAEYTEAIQQPTQILSGAYNTTTSNSSTIAQSEYENLISTSIAGLTPSGDVMSSYSRTWGNSSQIGSGLNATNTTQTSQANIESQYDGSHIQNIFTATDGADTTFITQRPYEVVVSGPAAFRGIEYLSDYSANYTNRSLVDKEYVDTAVAGGGGAIQSLAQVLAAGATASASIDMNSFGITEIGSLGTTTGETIEMINILNASLLTLMYNT